MAADSPEASPQQLIEYFCTREGCGMLLGRWRESHPGLLGRPASDELRAAQLRHEDQVHAVHPALRALSLAVAPAPRVGPPMLKLELELELARVDERRRIAEYLERLAGVPHQEEHRSLLLNLAALVRVGVTE